MHTREDLRRVVNETLVNRSRRWALGVGSVTAVISLVIYVYRKETKEAVATELSDVASRSLGDEKMQAQAQMATIQTLKALLEHEETVQRSVAFLSKVAEHEQTKVALVDLLVIALKSRAVLDEALALTLWVLNSESARENLVSALVAALCSERFEAAASDFVVRFFAREEVQDAVAAILKDASLNVLQEPNLQAKTSEHLWGALRGLVYTPRPPRTNPATAVAVGKGAATRPQPPRTASAASSQAAAEMVPAAEVEAQLAQQIVGQQTQPTVEPLLRRASEGDLRTPPTAPPSTAAPATAATVNGPEPGPTASPVATGEAVVVVAASEPSSAAATADIALSSPPLPSSAANAQPSSAASMTTPGDPQPPSSGAAQLVETPVVRDKLQAG